MPPKFLRISPNLAIPLSEVEFRSSRSSGPGGQNVNKVESRVELVFDVAASISLTDEQRARILKSLKNKIDSDGRLHLTSQKSRSQWQNKETIVAEFSRLLNASMKPAKARIRTRPSKAIREKRLKEKRKISEKKKTRGEISPD